MPSQRNPELIEMEPIFTTAHVEKELTFREALWPPSLRELRQKLRQKAKQQKRFRFYGLYGLVCRMDTLEAAWAAVKRNDGAPGVDGVSIERMAATSESEAAFLLGIQESLRKKAYQAKAVLTASFNGGNRYLSNTVVTLTAAPNADWSFLHWAGDSTDTTNVTTVIMDCPRNVQAIFGTSVSLFTNGSGEVSLDPVTGPYAYGSTVRIAVVPATGSYLFGWAGAASGFVNPLPLTVTNPLAVTALFATLNANQVTLATSVTGAGRIVVSPARNAYTNGDSVTLFAMPATNYLFSGWSGDASGTLNPLVLTLTATNRSARPLCPEPRPTRGSSPSRP
jgi:hypothetical protein